MSVGGCLCLNAMVTTSVIYVMLPYLLLLYKRIQTNLFMLVLLPFNSSGRYSFLTGFSGFLRALLCCLTLLTRAGWTVMLVTELTKLAQLSPPAATCFSNRFVHNGEDLCLFVTIKSSTFSCCPSICSMERCLDAFHRIRSWMFNINLNIL